MALSLMFVGAVGYAKVNGSDNEAKTPDDVEAVDLGLSVKWANMNVGATKESGFGTYFAWGEVKPKKYYSWGTYSWSHKDTSFLIKYSNTDKRTQLVLADDAARANWGGEWRMPTAKECEELTDPDKCKWEWITKDGINGYKVTGKKTGNSISCPLPVSASMKVFSSAPSKASTGHRLSIRSIPTSHTVWNSTAQIST